MSALGEGGCSCGAVRYRICATALFIHCCHCTKCQTESGSAFAVNALVETSAIELVAGDPVEVPVPAESGSDQLIMRCPTCSTALWGHYPGLGTHLAFVRAGTLGTRATIEPDVHVYTRSKLPWIELPESAAAFEGYYPMKELWPPESWARLKASRSATADVAGQ